MTEIQGKSSLVRFSARFIELSGVDCNNFFTLFFVGETVSILGVLQVSDNVLISKRPSFHIHW